MARAIRIGFLGNCYIFGYRGVAARATYPEILRRRIEAERPGVRVQLLRSALFHPADMPRQMTRLMSKQPDVIIVDAAATPVVSVLKPRVDVRGLPPGAARLIDGVQQGLSMVKGISERHRVIRPVLHAVDRVSQLVVDRKILPVERHAPPSVADYERFLEAAIRLVTASSTTLIVQGPSGFNHDLSHLAWNPSTLDLYRDMNEMVKRVTALHDVTMIDRQQIVEGRNQAMFLGNSVRLSAEGHQVTGDTLASTILAAHIL
jgi:hypothetical protein